MERPIENEQNGSEMSDRQYFSWLSAYMPGPFSEGGSIDPMDMAMYEEAEKQFLENTFYL